MKMETGDLEWMQVMKNLEELRLFGRLALRKGRRGENLSAGELELLFRVTLSEISQTPGMLSTSMGTSKTIISRLTEGLCKKELLKKEYDRNDRRSYSLVITERGKEELIQLCHYYLGPIYLIKEQMGQEAFEQMMNLIRQANGILADKQEFIKLSETERGVI